MILNLKPLNQLVITPHFKMESIHNVIHMIQLNSCIAPVDLKDVFY